MSKVRFPRRRADGSFCVEVAFSVETNDPEALLRRVDDWAVQWTDANRIWVRRWNDGKIEELLYQQEFKSAPQPTYCSSTELKIRLEGQPTSEKMWKDWLAYRIFPDLKASFSEVHDFYHIKNCD